jgi:hypothetical protein
MPSSAGDLRTLCYLPMNSNAWYPAVAIDIRASATARRRKQPDASEAVDSSAGRSHP